MRNHCHFFFSLPWKQTTFLILTLLTVFPLYTVAVEPAIQANGSVSLLLRNDGVLFQLGGQSFTPATLPPTAIPPIQPKSAILTNVDSLPTLKDQHGSYEGYYGNGMALAIASTPEVNLALFTWFPDSSDPTKAQPIPVSGLSEVKEIFLGTSCYHCFSYFVITNTGTVFGLDGNSNATQLSGLSDVKLITADPSRYVALTNTGTVFYGNWNSSNNQYDPAIQIANLTNVKDIKYLNNVTYALADDKVYGWTWVLDPATSTYLPTVVTAVKDAAGNELSEVKELRWKNQTLAVTQAGTVVWWKWNEDNKVPTVALPITGLPNVAEIVGKYSSYLARTLTGDVHYWTWKESSNAPTSASQIILPSTVKTLFIPGDNSDFAILNNGEVYSWYWDSSSSGNPSTPTQIQGLSNPKKIYYHYYSYYGYSYLSLTEGKEVYRINGNATLIPGLSNVKTIAIENHQLFLQEDGILCGIGNNSGGQLGINAPNYISYDDPLCGIEDLIVEPGTVFTSLTVNKTGTGEGTVTADTGTIYCGTSCSGNYPQKQTVTLRAKPQVGSTFIGWSDNCANTDSIIDPVTPVEKTKVTLPNAVTCTATFDKAPLRKLTVKKEGTGNGTVTVEPQPESGNLNCGSSTCTVNYKNLTEVTLTTTPDAGSEDTAKINCNNYDYWSNSQYLTFTKDHECTVTFAKLLANYPLNVSITSEDGSGGKVVSEPAGIDCSSDNCTKDFPNGTAVTLTPIPNPGSIVKEWYCGGYYNSASPATVTVKGRPAYCSISFRLPPDIEVAPPSHKFEFTGVGNRLTQDFSISNASVTNLRIDSIAVKGASDYRALEDNCSYTYKATNESCKISVAYEPHTNATQTATLWISSDDPETPLTIPFCAGAYSSTTQETEVSPTNLDFGTEVIGNSSTQTEWIKTWTDGCGALIDQNKFKLNGTNATDFNIILKECYYAAHDDKTDKPNKTTYSTCQVNVKFLPTTLEGTKNAQLDYALNDPSLPTSSVPLAGVAVATGSAQPKLEVSASSLNFGEVTLYRSSPQSTLTIKNTGNINLVPSIKLTDSDAAAFSVIGGECTSKKVLFPGNSCNLSVQFAPQGTVGNKQASLIIAPDKPYATTVTLTGNSIEATDCADANITIESVSSGYYWDSDAAWTRLKNLTGSDPNRPTDKDVVRIKSGHTFFGSADSTTVVKTLCIESGATLQSIDNKGTSLAIRATDFIGNWGTILGQDGANETEPCPTHTAVGTGSCAKRGASVILKVSTTDSGGPIVNEGTIKAGKGGSGSQYAAAGGDAIVLGRNVLNKNIIQAGDGGDISGTLEGESGPGGLTQVLGNFGGNGYLRSETSTQIAAGNGGYCNSSATEPQMGGKGGDLRLMTIPDVYIGGGNHRAGKSSYNCAKTRGDGRVGIDPNVISLAGANTRVEGGDIFIYGGPDWTLDLSNLTGPVVTATGNITLAVGENGVIDLRGSSGKLFNAVGQVSLFADNILLDENQKLSDLIEASQIVVGPHKILRDVTLTGAARVVSGPNTTTSLMLTLANGSPVNDTFSLTLTDPGGWISSTLPPTLDVAGLEVANLTLPITLPAEIGMTDTITVTAISQADPTVTATINIQVEVVDLTLLIANPSSPLPEIMEPEIPNSPLVSPFTIEPVSVSSGCPTTGVIDLFCSNQGQILQDATLTSAASITGGILAGTLTNQGLVSQVTIQAGSTLTGGKLTGHIINEGTLENFEFVGAVIEGGTLAGTITNRSHSEGTIKNVSLAPNTTISRVNLQGNIVGDNNAPALLEHVTIKSNTFLSGVKLGEGVIVEANVTCGEGVQAPEGVCSSDKMELSLLPDLGTTATNEQGKSVPSNAAFYGGISVNNGAIEAQAKPTLADKVTIQGQIQVDPDHVGQAGDVVVYIDYTPVGANEPVYVMLNETGKPVDWDGNLANLVPFKVIPKLAELIEVPMYQDKLPVTGMLNIEFGYRLVDGLVVHNLKPIEVNINP